MKILSIHTPGQDFKRNHIYVALNLMTLSNIQVFHDTRNIYWIDGIMGKLYCRLHGIRVRKWPGRDFLKEILSVNTGNFVLMGNKSGNMQIDMRFKEHYPLTNFKTDLESLDLSIIKNEIVIISLPSPFQERLSHLLDASNTIFCIGGALSMHGHLKLVPPMIVEKLGLEFLWRLNSDTKRRTMRLLKSIIDLIFNIVLLKRNYKPKLCFDVCDISRN